MLASQCARVVPFVAALACVLLSTAVVSASSPSAPPCAEDACRESCGKLPESIKQRTSRPPPEGAVARCIEVSVEGKDDPCDFEQRPACDCNARVARPGVTVVTQGLPEFAAWADGSDDECVAKGAVPGSCLLRGRDVRCNVGDDCTAVCNTWRMRATEERKRAETARFVSAACERENDACACIVDVGGGCFFGTDGNAMPVACDVAPDAAYRSWLDAERAKPVPEYCDRGSCRAAPRAVGHGGLGLCAALGLVGITLVRAGVRRSRKT